MAMHGFRNRQPTGMPHDELAVCLAVLGQIPAGDTKMDMLSGEIKEGLGSHLYKEVLLNRDANCVMIVNHCWIVQIG